ncbi:hypothetical protein LJK88_20935 [Paenibacillus sp. P26]|nr:hypothetical protein LJK88_20935 [Paenibacillus sp. P26]UUZ95908.1 hypothetical protein LJK87_16925 [Paenibacillus sp. P25]
MTTELCFHNRKIPVSFISSDQKAIPRLISVLENTRSRTESSDPSYLNQIERIEIIGNNAILHRSEENDSIQLPLY